MAVVVATNYEQYLSIVRERGPDASLPLDKYFVINDGIWLCPILVILIVRRYNQAVVAYALALSTLLAGRIYYLLPPSLTGVDGIALKYDWSSLGLSLLGVISGCVSILWLIVRLVMLADRIGTKKKELR